MDESKFDDLTRFMAETPSRRTVVKALVGAIAGSLASVATALGAPRCKRVNQACQTTADCCPGPNANGNVYCKSISKNAKVCATCPTSTPTACNGGCINTASDNTNCGACGNVCHGGTTCVNGSCQCPTGQYLCADGSCQECCADSQCPPGQGTCCSGTCKNLDGDEANCGACGHVCLTNHICTNNGQCQCPPGQVEDVSAVCQCGDADCATDASCCDGWYCNPDSSVCKVCQPAGTYVGTSPSNRACCSRAVSDGICVNQCSSDTDCQAGTGQICDTSVGTGLCQCPSGTQLVAGGACV